MTKLEKYITETIAKINIEDYITANEDTLKKIVKQNATKLNTQMNRLLSHGVEIGKISNEAYESVEKTGGLFSTISNDPNRIHMNRNELLHELARELYTANLKTFTIEEAKKARQYSINSIQSSIQYKQFFDKHKTATEEDFYNRIIEENLEDYEDYVEEHGNYSEFIVKQNFVISEFWRDFHQFQEEHPNLESKRALEYYQKANNDTNNLMKEIRKDQQEKERKQQEVIENATKQTGYQPKWEF